MTRVAKIVTLVGVVAAILGSLLAYKLTGSPMFAVIWAVISCPGPCVVAWIVQQR